MTIEEVKKLVDRRRAEHNRFIKNAKIARRYHQNKNDITIKRSPGNRNNEDRKPTPIKKADNRASNNFHQLLVDQKNSYTLGTSVQFDVENDELNGQIVDILGDKFPRISKALGADASNTSIAWLHVWIDENNNKFNYESVDPVQIIPIFNKNLDKRLESVVRIWEDDFYTHTEVWTETECHAFKQELGKGGIMETNPTFRFNDVATNVFQHHWGRVPFIPFYNNDRRTNDLNSYKDLIDVYDKTYNGFVNDVEDIQEVIIVLKGYGGEDLNNLLEKLNDSKAIDVEEEGDVNALKIEIPVEARKEVLEITRKRIFEAGQGLDPQDDRIGVSSGVALEFKYNLLEIKASLLEIEFREGYAELVRFILQYLGKSPENFPKIEQVWERTAIRNDVEQAEIVSKLSTISSKEAVAKANPIVDNYQRELELLKADELEDLRMTNDYTSDEDE